MTTNTELVVWTPLPNGHHGSGEVLLSVFVTPQLESTAATEILQTFTDWINWPKTLLSAPLRFSVVFKGHPPITVSPDLSLLSPTNWAAVFDPMLTKVDPYTFKDYATITPTSFSVEGLHTFVASTYGTLGAATPLAPLLLQTTRGIFGVPGSESTSSSALVTKLATALKGLKAIATNAAIADARKFHKRPYNTAFSPTTPVYDFHQTVAAFGSYPDVLVNLGLVIPLVVPLPAGLTHGEVEVTATPEWSSAFTGAGGDRTVNVVLSTHATLTATQFLARPTPTGPDYANGMLDLHDASRFSVVDLDVDGAAEALAGLSNSMDAIDSWVKPYEQDGAQVAVTVPALRSIGPSIVWRGWGSSGKGLNALASRQAAVQAAVAKWVDWDLHPLPRPPEPSLPVLYAEDVIRGCRIDVHSALDPTPTWRSLHERVGSYVFGTQAASPLGGPDEGTVVPGATQTATPAGPLPDLYVHEAIARWAGWSLAAPRNGPSIAPDDELDMDPTNPVPSNTEDGNQNAQFAATFSVVPGSLPRLRFGTKYRYRARAVDLGGHSLPVTSTDASTATLFVPHYRYEPVPSPVVVPTAPLGPGEAALLLVIRNYQTTPTDVVAQNGRWLFPPRGSEMLIEEHGMLDGYAPGEPPDPTMPPTPAAFTLLTDRIDATLDDVPGVQHDDGNNMAPYLPIPASGLPAPLATPWLADPASSGASLHGLPGTGLQYLAWPGSIWPDPDPFLLLLQAGASAGHSFTAATDSTAAVATVTLAPAQVADVFLSSTTDLARLETLGVFEWILGKLPASEHTDTTILAELGRLWMLTPYRVIRLVHAVRVPLVKPAFVVPIVQPRIYGSIQATLTDADFLVSAASTASIDVEAAWTDPLDDPSDPTNDPTTDTTSTTAHAFKLEVPDPAPLGPFAEPLHVQSPRLQAWNDSDLGDFALSSPGAIHVLGDTKHHEVTYTPTGTSRFVEFFRTTVNEMVFTSSAPVTIDVFGLDPTEVTITTTADGTALVQGTDFTVDGPAGQIAITNPSDLNVGLDVTYVPADTATGPGRLVHVLASARPPAPKVVKVTPAWEIAPTSGEVSDGGLTYQRIGGYLRVYLDRPWYASGPNELLGVVAVPASAHLKGELPAAYNTQWVTTMGLDPISVSSMTEQYPISPNLFGHTASVPAVPYRPPYSSPPLLPLVEDPAGKEVSVWPYAVVYDHVQGLWFADVSITVGAEDAAPPPGYFVRLALVRFQPYAFARTVEFPGAELSTVTLATFAQPVSNRAVSVTENSEDPTQSVNVTVTGAGYYGYRPMQPGAKQQWDYENPDAKHPYTLELSSIAAPGKNTSSLMLVEVQVQDASKGLSGDLAWTTPAGFGPTALTVTFSGNPLLTWKNERAGIALPHPIGTVPMRLRISEVDYATSVPTTVNTSLRRPFVAFITIS
jgi:hypothetical protein